MHESTIVLLRAQLYTFQGRLAGRPEVKYLNGGNSVANARIAVDLPDHQGRSEIRPSDWFKLEMWGDAGQAFADGCDKGDLIEVTGRIRTETWTDSNSGENRWGHVLRMIRWQLVAQNSRSGSQPTPTARPQRPPAPPVWDGSGGVNNDDVPF